ncbi:MAG: DUF4124 domain-containing protein [Deltaproteobacteria bacterium]|nr:DUF4124 domain-containing protein [Deltaproteobacteria bacterium]
MKFIVVIFMLFIGLSVFAQADIYQWTDNNGVVNFTDSLGNVPKKYQKKVKVLPSADSSQQGAGAEPAELAAPEGSAVPAAELNQQAAQPDPQSKIFGGHNETWWRSQYGSLRRELAQLQTGLPAKRTELEQLRRKLVLYTYARNRVAYQEKLAEIKRDEERINSLTEQLADLDTQASSAGIPFEWRQ